MQRRNLLQLACAIMPVSLLATRAEAAVPDAARVVYHLDDLEKVDMVFGNIKIITPAWAGPTKSRSRLSCSAWR